MTTAEPARPARTGARAAAAARRKARERDIVAATREVFDAQGMRDAQIEEIARAVGLNRAIIYRHFTGKDELFALTLVSYLDDLAEVLSAAVDSGDSATDRLAALIGAFVDFGVAHPAFVDCAQALMSRTGPELFDELSEGAMLRLGRAIAGCLRRLSTVLDEGQRSGEFKRVDSAVLANHMYASGLGALQLARVGMLVRESAPGVPEVVPLSREQVRTYLVATARALATD